MRPWLAHRRPQFGEIASAQQDTFALIQLVLASLLWSASFALIGATGIQPDLLAATRLGLALLLFLPLALRRPLPRPRGVIPRLVGVGALQYGVMYVLVLRSYRYLEGHEVALMTVTTPILVVLVEGCFARRVGYRSLSAALLSVVAAAVLKAGGEGGFGDGYWTGVALVQGANLAWATGQVVYRRIDGRASAPPGDYAWVYAGAFLLALAWAVPNVPSSALELSSTQAWTAVYLGLVPSGLAFYLWNRGATQVRVGTLAVLNNLKVPLAVLVALMPPFSEPADLPRLGLSSTILLIALGIVRGGR